MLINEKIMKTVAGKKSSYLELREQFITLAPDYMIQRPFPSPFPRHERMDEEDWVVRGEKGGEAHTTPPL